MAAAVQAVSASAFHVPFRATFASSKHISVLAFLAAWSGSRAVLQLARAASCDSSKRIAGNG